MGCVSAIDSNGRTIWIADAHDGDGKRFVARADEKLTAFLELESVIRSRRKPSMKIIEVKPFRSGWKVFEAPGVEPVFVGSDSRRQAIAYAKTRQGFGQGEIRVLNSAGDIC